MNVPIIKLSIQKDKSLLAKAIKEYIDEEHFYRIIRQTLIDFVSFDYLDLIYDNGYCLSDFIESGYVSELFKNVLNAIRCSGRYVFTGNTLNKPTEEEIDMFFNEKLTNRNMVSYVGSYLMLKKMIKKEEGKTVDYNRIYGKLASVIYHNGICGTLIKELLYII